MQEQEILKNLILELKSAAANYQAEAEAFDSPKDKLIFELLAQRCQRFEREIGKAADAALKINLRRAAAGGGEPNKDWGGIKERAQIFVSIEESESRLERFYREILRNKTISREIREILVEHFEVIYKWHNFVITEEVNFVFGGELTIPSELSEV